MRTETYNVTTGHVYHVYCALGGNVYKAKDAVAASGWLESDNAGEAFVINGVDISEFPDDRTSVEAWTALFAENECGVTCTGVDGPSEPDSDTVKVHIQAVEPGAAGNAITLEADGAGARVSGETLEGGADAQRVLIGELDSFDCVRYVPASGWPRIEVDVPDEAWVQVRDKDSAWVSEQAPTEPGQFYNVYADDDVRILYRNTELLALPGFGGTGGFQAPGMEVTVKRKENAEVSIMDCAAADCLSTEHLTYPVISDLT